MNPLYRCAFDRKKCFGYKPPPVEEHEEHSYCSETNVRRSPPPRPPAPPLPSPICAAFTRWLWFRGQLDWPVFFLKPDLL